MHVHLYEKIWIALAALLVVVFVGSIVGTTVAHIATPPSHEEHIDPARVNDPDYWKPRTETLSDGSVIVTLRARIWTFDSDPNPVVVPAGKKVTFRITSPDVIHGFEIIGTNVNMMAVPGYVSQVSTIFSDPGEYLVVCNEYCGIEHHTMSTKIKVTEGKR